MGPTAIGKTSLAIELYIKLAQEWPIDIISVDSAMVYRGLNIGTGKPTEDILSRVPHGLVDIREPYEVYTVADFCTDAQALIKHSHVNNRVPLLVGGTMMYFNALKNGLSTLPSSDPKIRAQLTQRIEAEGLLELYTELQTVDPLSASRINPNDKQRILRALEVYLITGRSLTFFLSQPTQDVFSVNHTTYPSNRNIIIAPSNETKRAELHKNIEIRFHEMLNNGFIEEVEVLFLQDKVHKELPAIKSCGYNQIWQYLSGEMTKEVMIEKSIASTRQLAKRQLTWLRSYRDTWDNITWLEGPERNLLAKMIKVLNF